MKFQDISSNLHELCQEYSYLSYLDAESRAAIEKLAVKPEVLQPNETMDVEPWNYFILIAEGLLEVQHDDYCDQQLDMPYIVGLVEFTTRYNGKLSIRALSPVTCYRIDLKRFDEIHGSVHWIQEYIRRFYELEVRRLYKEKADLEDHLQDYFLPENSGMVPGPYGAHHISTLLFVMQDSPDRLRKLLPPFLRPSPLIHGRYMMVFSHFKDMTSFNQIGGERTIDYHESAIFIPAVSANLQAGFYCPALFPDNYLAIALGREIYGFPKRFGQTTIDQGRRLADLIVDGQTTLRARWEAWDPLSDTEFLTSFVQDMWGPSALLTRLGAWGGRIFEFSHKNNLEDLWPRVPVFVRHQVPAMAFENEKTPVYAQDRLVKIPFEVRRLLRLRRLRQPKVEMFRDDFLVGGEAVAAYSFEMGMQFAQSRVVMDYDWSARRARRRWRELKHRLQRGIDLSHALWDVATKEPEPEDPSLQEGAEALDPWQQGTTDSSWAED